MTSICIECIHQSQALHFKDQIFQLKNFSQSMSTNQFVNIFLSIDTEENKMRGRITDTGLIFHDDERVLFLMMITCFSKDTDNAKAKQLVFSERCPSFLITFLCRK